MGRLDGTSARAMPPVTAAELGALFRTCAVATSDDSPSRHVPPKYTHRHGWRPSAHPDFGDGGSFPELDVVQMPHGLGWDSARFPNVEPLAALDCSFDELQANAARCVLRLDSTRNGAPRRATPEYDTFVSFLKDTHETLRDSFSQNQTSDDADAFADALLSRFMDAHPNAQHVERVTDIDPRTFGQNFLNKKDGLGVPVVVADGGRAWTNSKTWTSISGLKTSPLARRKARCNDRAPARRADAVEEPDNMQGSHIHGTKQRTCELPFFEFLTYVEGRPKMDFDKKSMQKSIESLANADAPFYCNGWRAFEQEVCDVDDIYAQASTGDVCQEKNTPSTAAQAFPPPYFASQIDCTKLIAAQTREIILDKISPGRNHTISATCAAESLDASLAKLFIGPCGTVTRMHQDAGEAHGWLGQVFGDKLFILCPPSDSRFLREIKGEVETSQSYCDPLDMSKEAVFENALFWEKASPLITVLKPNETLVIPKGWWHYAAALSPSLTAMKNFYDAEGNVKSLVQIVAKGASGGGSVTDCGPTNAKGLKKG